MATRSAKVTEYVNRTQGWLSARKVNRRGEEENVQLAAGDRVFLTDEERDLTDRAPRRREDSPFTPREIVWHALQTGEEIARFTAAPLTAVDDLPEGELPEVVAMRRWQEANEAQMAALGVG